MVVFELLDERAFFKGDVERREKEAEGLNKLVVDLTAQRSEVRQQLAFKEIQIQELKHQIVPDARLKLATAERTIARQGEEIVHRNNQIRVLEPNYSKLLVETYQSKGENLEEDPEEEEDLEEDPKEDSELLGTGEESKENDDTGGTSFVPRKKEHTETVTQGKREITSHYGLRPRKND